jgi:hypothetical protein
VPPSPRPFLAMVPEAELAELFAIVDSTKASSGRLAKRP